MDISILDYGQVDEGRTVGQALQETVELAQEAERLGFHRFWVAEHHNLHALSISNPELMMMHLADQTQTIRIGSGGIMGLHYSPYKIAETIRTLTALHPGRIDLGLGNSLGTPTVTRALKSIHQREDYPDLIQAIKDYLDDKPIQIVTHPQVTDQPQLWNLSMSARSAQMAGQAGMGYTFGVFPYVDQDPVAVGQAVAQAYFDHFSPSQQMAKPRLMLAVFIALAETEAEAQKLAKSLDVWMLGKKDFNDFVQFPSYETATAYELTQADQEKILSNRQRILVGTPETVLPTLTSWLAACQADEILAIPLLPGYANRLKNLHLLKELQTKLS